MTAQCEVCSLSRSLGFTTISPFPPPHSHVTRQQNNIPSTKRYKKEHFLPCIYHDHISILDLVGCIFRYRLPSQKYLLLHKIKDRLRELRFSLQKRIPFLVLYFNMGAYGSVDRAFVSRYEERSAGVQFPLLAMFRNVQQTSHSIHL